jgi:hypothetical protein
VTAVILDSRDCATWGCTNDATRGPWCDHDWRHTPRETRAAAVAAYHAAHGRQAAMRHFKLSNASLYAYLDDPDGSKDKARKAGYGGVCAICGGATYGGEGRANAPRLCQDCSAAERSAAKQWTRETVVDAIRRWATSHHGNPPTATDWLHADPLNGYPHASSVYSVPSAPFRKWADAIEAAGFPRPRVGQHKRIPLTRGRNGQAAAVRNERKRRGEMPAATREFVVLHEQADGTWKIIAETDEPTEITALNKALNGAEPSGNYVAVPNRYWLPRALKPRTVYDWEETTT